jgi:hypothetical protein
MFRKFGPNDIILNTMRATPRSHFFIYNSQIYYNDMPSQTFTDGTGQAQQVTTLQRADGDQKTVTGFISLYEYNIARTSGSFDDTYTRTIGADGEVSVLDGTVPMIFPYLSKDSARASFKTAVGGDTIEGMTPTFYNNEFAFGDILTASYPQVCTITREFIEVPSGSGEAPAEGTYNRHYVSLKNLFNIYSVKSRHFAVSSSFADKNKQIGNLIHVPSLFYGTKIRPGTLSLKWYFTGSLIGELRDTKRNGELIQVSGASPAGSYAADNNEKVAGVVMYNEGFIYLTGSWDLARAGAGRLSLDNSASADGTVSRTKNLHTPSWIYWGAGMNDGRTQDSTNNDTKWQNINSASFSITFEGETKTQVMTMYAHARRGEANYSNNPTFLEYGQAEMKYTSSHVYEENPSRLMKNTVSSAYGTGAIASGYTASFQRQVYISKIGVYDKDYNLIGVATLGSPVLKKEDEDLAFKLKMDF